MIYSIDGALISIDGNIMQRRVSQLTFQVKDKWFPRSYYDSGNINYVSGSEVMEFTSITPNSAVVNYGDGTIVVKQFIPSGSLYTLKLTCSSAPGVHIPQHTFTDGFDGVRSITFDFENPDGISGLSSKFVRLTGSLPQEVVDFNNINSISYSRAVDVANVPDIFPKGLKTYSLSSSLRNKKYVIEDNLFECKLTGLSLNADYVLSDTITSNFFKINQFKDSLVALNLENCMIIELPSSLGECKKLEDVRLGGNRYTSIPTVISELDKVRLLYIGSSTLTDLSIPVWENCKELSTLWFSFPNCDLTDIPTSWRYLYSLSNIFSITGMIVSNARFDLWVDSCYELCTLNGSIISDAGNFGGLYPNRFRNISWGHATLSFTGAKIAPSGYVQGVSNGTPTTQGQKAYVLQNQYNHTITHGTPL